MVLIGDFLQHAVKFYRDRLKKLPVTILLYRDGVSEGEYAQVQEQEIKPLQGTSCHHGVDIRLFMSCAAMLAAVYKTQFRLVFIVVGKRYIAQ